MDDASSSNLVSWTAGEHTLFLRLVHEGYTDVQIAQHLGRSKSAIGSRRRRCKLMPSRSEPGPLKPAVPFMFEEDEIVIGLFAQGKTDVEIGKVLDRSASSVRGRRQILGLEKVCLPSIHTRSKAEQYCTDLKSGRKAAIGDDPGFIRAAVYAHLWDLENAHKGQRFPNLDIPEGYNVRKVVPQIEQLSYCGSSAAMCEG